MYKSGKGIKTGWLISSFRLVGKTRIERRAVRTFAELEQFPVDLRDYVEEGYVGDRETDRYHETCGGETHHRHHHGKDP